MRTIGSTLLAGGIALCAPLAASAFEEFSVGSGADCTHRTIAAAIEAAGANGPDGDDIYVTEGEYAAQALQIVNQTLMITGGMINCTDRFIVAPSILNGAGNGGLPIIMIKADSSLREVNLNNLKLTGSSASGLVVLGRLHVFLNGTDVVGNSASKGGGIYLKGNGPQAMARLQLGPYYEVSRVTDNRADWGGGVYADEFSVLATSGALIADNSATIGGGIFGQGGNNQIALAGFDEATAGSVIEDNRAELDGGGVYLQYGAFISTQRATDTSPMPQIRNNTAGRNGGGVYVGSTPSYISVHDLTIHGNTAGALGNGNGGGVYLTPNTSAILDVDVEGRTCGRPTPCVLIEDNRAGINGFSGKGGAAYVESNAILSATHARIARNRADRGAAVFADGIGTRAILTSTLVEDSGGSGFTFAMESGAKLQLRGSTLGNDESAQGMIWLNGGELDIDTSIVYAPGSNIVSRAPMSANTVTSNCVLAHAGYVSDLGTPTVGDPAFVNATAGDYRLRLTSPAIDACDNSRFAFDDTDLSLHWRGIDTIGIANSAGTFDLGAYEFQDDVFADGFE